MDRKLDRFGRIEIQDLKYKHYIKNSIKQWVGEKNK